MLKLFEPRKVQARFNAILEVVKVVYDTIFKEGNVNLGRDKCRVYDALNVKQCFNCWRYNHHSIECKTNKVCPKCSEEYKEKKTA